MRYSQVSFQGWLVYVPEIVTVWVNGVKLILPRPLAEQVLLFTGVQPQDFENNIIGDPNATEDIPC